MRSLSIIVLNEDSESLLGAGLTVNSGGMEAVNTDLESLKLSGPVYGGTVDVEGPL